MKIDSEQATQINSILEKEVQVKEGDDVCLHSFSSLGMRNAIEILDDGGKRKKRKVVSKEKFEQLTEVVKYKPKTRPSFEPWDPFDDDYASYE